MKAENLRPFGPVTGNCAFTSVTLFQPGSWLKGFFIFHVMEYEFQGLWIPASVLLDEKLTPFQKLLIAEIDGLSGPKNGPCHASSGHLAKVMNSTDGNIRTELSKLTKQGYLIQLGGDGITTWRCVAPKYSSNLGKYAAWLEDKKLPKGVSQNLQGCQLELTGSSLTTDRGVSATTDTENRSNTEYKKTSSSSSYELMTPEKAEEFVADPKYAGVDVALQTHYFKAWCTKEKKEPTVYRFKRWLEYRIPNNGPSQKDPPDRNF